MYATVFFFTRILASKSEIVMNRVIDCPCHGRSEKLKNYSEVEKNTLQIKAMRDTRMYLLVRIRDIAELKHVVTSTDSL